MEGPAETKTNTLFQSERHPLTDEKAQTIQTLVLHLLHVKAYREAGILATGKKVLDLGCNNGYGSRILAETAREVLALDISERAVAAAATPPLPDNLRFQTTDGVKLDLPDRSIDVVTSFQVIEHVENVGPYLAEIGRVLAPDGIAIFTTPNGSVRLDPGMRPWNIFHIREYSAGELRDELKPYFSAVEVRGLHGDEEPTRIEQERVDRLRNKARNPIWRAASDMVIKHVPEGVRHGVDRFIANLSADKRANALALANDARTRITLDSFRFNTENLDAAMHFMAVCKRKGSQKG